MCVAARFRTGGSFSGLLAGPLHLGRIHRLFVLQRQLPHQRGQPGSRGSVQVQVLHHLVEVAAAGQAGHGRTQVGGGFANMFGQVAHPGALGTGFHQVGGQALQQGLVAGSQLAAVFGQVNKGPALGHATFLHQGFQQQAPVGVVHAQAGQAAQAGGVGADLVGGVLVVGGQGVQHGTAQVLPGGLADDEVTGQAAMR